MNSGASRDFSRVSAQIPISLKPKTIRDVIDDAFEISICRSNMSISDLTMFFYVLVFVDCDKFISDYESEIILNARK